MTECQPVKFGFWKGFLWTGINKSLNTLKINTQGTVLSAFSSRLNQTADSLWTTFGESPPYSLKNLLTSQTHKRKSSEINSGCLKEEKLFWDTIKLWTWIRAVQTRRQISLKNCYTLNITLMMLGKNTPEEMEGTRHRTKKRRKIRKGWKWVQLMHNFKRAVFKVA